MRARWPAADQQPSGAGLTSRELKLFADETLFAGEGFSPLVAAVAIGEDDGVIDLGEFCCSTGMDGKKELSRQRPQLPRVQRGLSVLGLGSLRRAGRMIGR
ncbi:unnamed protein product [Vitrella brassicaformis CCMP3155]|uniref:Uncharacterized protein n=1 Tax=Vitrella brassicaformis (strain CCMP3155) TaxID=1169540 RepID=A0A0G4FB19_VITBC|nr:unnamed protein product [Vitrella brassicaformis CCMP3155]|eukprot:CEM10099.1 unnamed protein product [Vitrella brassicaformis CCMP3155]